MIPDQSSNNLYPLPLFLETLKELCDLQDQGNPVNFATMNNRLMERWSDRSSSDGLVRKENSFSDSEYRFIKFICRKLITIKKPNSNDVFSFFYPFEVQIMNEASHLRNQSGASSHLRYKERQRKAARMRLFQGGVVPSSAGSTGGTPGGLGGGESHRDGSNVSSEKQSAVSPTSMDS